MNFDMRFHGNLKFSDYKRAFIIFEIVGIVFNRVLNDVEQKTFNNFTGVKFTFILLSNNEKRT